MNSLEKFTKSKKCKPILWILNFVEIVFFVYLYSYYLKYSSNIPEELLSSFQTNILVLLMSIVLYFICITTTNIKPGRLLFIIFSFINYLGIVSAVVCIISVGNAEMRTLYIFAKLITLIVDQLVVVLLWWMIKSLYYGEIKTKRAIDISIITLAVVSILLLIINALNGFIYEVNSSAITYYHNSYLLLYIPNVVELIFLGIIFFKNKLSFLNYLIFQGFSLLVILSVILEFDFGENNTYYFLILFCFQFMIYGINIVSRESEMNKKEIVLAATEKELDVASNIQNNMLPVDFETLDKYGIDVYASMNAAKEVGGDFYDFFVIDEYKTGYAIGAVSGKGIPAALLMTVGKALIQKSVIEMDSLSKAITSVHRTLCKSNSDQMFITLWVGVIDRKNNTLTYVNAGHTKTYIKRGSKNYQQLLELHGTAMGCDIAVDRDYRESVIEFNPGDKLFMYTDGVTEANNINDEMYNNERLEKQLNRKEINTSQELVQAVYEDVIKFQGKAEQFDDITMLAVNYLGNTENSI